MQITALNKLIRLFLIGAFAALPVATVYWSELRAFLGSAAFLEKAGLAIPVSLLILTVASAVGCLIEGLADVTLRRLLQRTMQSKKLAALVLKSDEHSLVNSWRLRFESATRRVGIFPEFLLEPNDSPKSLASAILHNKGLEAHVRWVDTHYSMFMLASGFGLVILASTAYPIFLLFHSGFSIFVLGVAGGCLAATYCICVFAVDNYLYAYEAIYRFAYLWISDYGGAGLAPMQVVEDHQTALATEVPRVSTEGATCGQP